MVYKKKKIIIIGTYLTMIRFAFDYHIIDQLKFLQYFSIENLSKDWFFNVNIFHTQIIYFYTIWES